MKDGSFQLESDNLKGPRPSWRAVVLGSCEGVLLLTNNYSRNDFMLWNPSNKAKTFFRFPYKFEPEKAIYGLAHDPGTNDFKVVIAYDTYYAVYSFNNNSWTDKMDFCYGSWNSDTAISADGVIYWHATSYPEGTDVEFIYFDPRNDEFKTLEKPVNIFKEFGNETMFWLGCVRDCLCLLCYMTFDQTELQIWKKEEGVNDNTWNKLMVIEHEKPMCTLYSPVFLSENNEIVFQLHQLGYFLRITLLTRRLLLNVENVRRLKRKQSEPLELQK
ncbi:hypothetical protein CASFOL_012706 [Castilleja foliolosa]|uniref:F-box associated beta-propeller type 1 domain-containing protein n=1 Tax=Castilleja foliolosa TaxID=1961234 RepID=A0ABD3DLX2_9LAMI